MQIGIEGVGGGAGEGAWIDDQHAALPAQGQPAQVDTVLVHLLRARRHAVEGIVHGEGQRHVGEGVDLLGVVDAKGANLLERAACDHRFCLGLGVGCRLVADHRQRIGLGLARQQMAQGQLGGCVEQGAENRAAIDVEQHQLAAVGRQEVVEVGDDGAGADRVVHHRLEGECRREGRQFTAGRQLAHLLLNGVGQPVGLTCPIDREGVVFERVEFGHDAEPGRVGKGGQQGGHCLQSGETGKAGHPYHGGDEHQPIRPCQCPRFVFQRIQRVFHRQRAAVGKPHQMQWQRARGLCSGLAHRQSRRRQPGLPRHIDQPGGHCAVTGYAQTKGDKALLAIALGQVAQAVRGIGQAVQEHGYPFYLALGAQQVGAIPVVLKAGRVDGRALIVAIARQLLLRRRLGDHLLLHQIEQLLLASQIGWPVAAIQFVGAELGGNEGMPQLQRRSLPGEVGDGPPSDQQRKQECQKRAAKEATGTSQHGVIPGRWRSGRTAVKLARRVCLNSSNLEARLKA